MSSNNRATAKGGKGGLKGDKAHKMDKSDAKGAGDKQHSSMHGGGDSLTKEDKISKVLELTQRSENQVCLALHECDYNLEQAVDMLLDLPDEDEWETTVKKRKNRQQSAGKNDPKSDNSVSAAADDPWGDATNTGAGDKPRNKAGGGSAQRFHGGRHNESRGWRGRERQENERNMEDGSGVGRERRGGRPGGSTRGAGGGGRGRGGGRAGARYPRSNRGGGGGTFNNRPMETWDNSWDAGTNAAAAANNHTEENWGDEWCGTLSETKVFTPSQPVEPTVGGGEPELAVSAPGVAMDATGGAVTVQQSMDNMLAQMGTAGGGGGGVGGGAPSAPVAMSGTLNAAQSQYFSQLTQQSNNNEMGKFASTAPQQQQPQQQPPPASYGNNNAQYAAAAQQQQQQPPPQPAANVYANAAYTNSYGAPDGNASVHQQQQPPTRTKVRAKIPPPSKIPATAVEMPGDLPPNMGILDLQFGAMDLMSDSSSFDGVAEQKYQNSSSILDANAVPSMDLNNQPASVTLDAYSPTKPSAQSSISSALTQSLSNSDSIPQTSEHLSSGYSTSSAVAQQQQQQQRSTSAASSNAAGGASVAPASSLDALNKQQQQQPAADAHAAYASQATSYSSYQTNKSSSNYPNQTYSSSANYSGTQTTNSSYAPNPAGNSYVNSSDAAAAYSNSNAANSSYQNTYSANAAAAAAAASAYQSNAGQPPFPSITQGGGTYPASNQSYQQNASQSVYGAGGGGGGGANAGLNNSNYASNSSTQYNNYNSNHKLVKDGSSGAYDAGTTVTNSLTTTAPTSTPLALISTTTSSKTNTTLSKNSNSVVSNIPPSATPVMGQYIMGQVPYFQPPMYSYEEMQMLQQRIPHMTTPFYEMSYQTPATTLREGSYSLSDGRYARTDSNASPVSSTQTSTQPMLAAQTTGPYFFTPYSPMQPSYQFGAVYTPQIPAGTNAHGSNTTAQYPKPANYGSAYTSGYESLTQTQDYGKAAGYVSNTQGASKGGAANATTGANAANDLSMYAKSHTALGKVNSYEKQGFHSGTPPPFTGALGQSALAPSGTGYGPQMYIPTMPHQQHHSTQLMHGPMHQMEVRHHGRRMDSGNSTGQRAQGNNQQKSGSKQAYPNSYWNQS